MKRSRSIRLVLLGGLSAGAFSGCDPSGGSSSPSVVGEAVFTNNHYLPGAGYYHAPFQAWYQLPFNHYDPQSQRYFFGGQWNERPFESIVNISTPNSEGQRQLNPSSSSSSSTSVRRFGFGSTGSRFSTSS